jgi:hypothetical protein
MGNGMLREGAAAKIINILEAAPGVTSVVLNSNGGRLFEAKQLAHAVQSRNLNTYVEHSCESACTYVFSQVRTVQQHSTQKSVFTSRVFQGSTSTRKER